MNISKIIDQQYKKIMRLEFQIDLQSLKKCYNFVNMYTSISNNDFICFQMRNNLYPQFNNPLKKEIDKLSLEVKNYISNQKRIPCVPTPFFRSVFNMRIKVIKWMSKSSNTDYMQVLEDVYPQIEEMKADKYFAVLIENILFALRCNKRVIQSLIANNMIKQDFVNETVDNLTEINYDQQIASFAIIPNDSIAQKLLDWLNSSLQIEFVIMAADIIDDEKLKLNNKVINDLAFLVADAAQLYTALSQELGFYNRDYKIHNSNEKIFDNDYIREQKHIADLGLNDFALNF